MLDGSNRAMPSQSLIKDCYPDAFRFSTRATRYDYVCSAMQSFLLTFVVHAVGDVHMRVMLFNLTLRWLRKDKHSLKDLRKLTGIVCCNVSQSGHLIKWAVCHNVQDTVEISRYRFVHTKSITNIFIKKILKKHRKF